MHDAEGEMVIVFNGEIYNFAELRTELVTKGHKFLTDHSDTEVLLRGYREWGKALPNRLNGMWSFVIFDSRYGRLFASRDRFGKKPFYYAIRAGTFAFASELTALRLHPATPTAISRRALMKFFGYGYIPAPNSILEGVRKLPGGHSLIFEVSTHQLRVERYWEFVIEPFERLPKDPDSEWAEELRFRLGAAVKRRLVADVPVGVFLSGGIDSSAMTALAARHLPQGRLKTFSIGFDDASFDESAYARTVADLFGTDHMSETLSIERARELLPEIVSKLDEPMGDSSLLPTYLLSRFARRHVTVAIGGDGGDELFAGYDPFRAIPLAQMYRKCVPHPVHRAIELLANFLPVSHRNMSFDFRLKRLLRGLGEPARLWMPSWMATLDRKEMTELFCETADFEDIFSEAIEIWDGCAQPDPVDRSLQFFTRIYLQDDILTKVDRASMMLGLEVRSPFLDIEVVDLARRIPWRWKYRHGRTKHILKRALIPLLPHDILHRKKKGFGVPIGDWFRRGWLAPATSGPPSSLNCSFVARKLAEHRAGRADQRAFLWNIWLWQTWSAGYSAL